MSNFKVLKFFVIFIIFFFPNIGYSEITPEKFIKEVTKEASNILKQDITKEEKSSQLINLAKKTVDIRGIGLYTLGKHKKTISSEQLQIYEELFNVYFLKSFSSRLSEYSDPKIDVLSQNFINNKYTMVSSILVGDEKRPEISIEWRVYTKDPDNY